MSYVLTNSTLGTSIQQYCERQDARFVENIPTFIMLGQRRICNELNILEVRKTVLGSLSSMAPTLNKDGDWLDTSSFQIGTGPGFATTVLLQKRSYAFCQYYWPNQTMTGTPKYYTDEDINSLSFYPTPDQNYPYKNLYFALPAFLDDTQGINILTAKIPNLLLKACLVETAPFLKDDDRIPMWEQEYQKLKADLSEQDIKRVYDAYTMRGM